jgi:cytochrome c oxidase subunit 2
MLIFLVYYFGFFAWQVYAWGDRMLPVSASAHGVGIDNLMTITMSFIIPVFIITHILLFWFAFKYSYSSKRKATFFSHSNKLEMIWTIVPSFALTILILYGLSNWNKIMTPVAEDEEHVLIELVGQQFSWGARYAGEDGKLGRANVNYIEGTNFMGVDASDANSSDDKIVKGEFHLPVNVPVQFVMRSNDVMHSAYMPHFRAQMNCVPGMKTQFNFVPTVTTKEMKEITGNEDFEYILLCNKICGAAHYNMQMNIIVESKEDYEKWLAEQKTFAAK